MEAPPIDKYITNLQKYSPNSYSLSDGTIVIVSEITLTKEKILRGLKDEENICIIDDQYSFIGSVFFGGFKGY
jgi:hypothetical protein